MKKILIISLFLLAGCTTVNTNGSIHTTHYKIIKDGTHNSLEVETISRDCPIIDVDTDIHNNKSHVVVKCETVLK